MPDTPAATDTPRTDTHCGYRFKSGILCGADPTHDIHNGKWYKGREPDHDYEPEPHCWSLWRRKCTDCGATEAAATPQVQPAETGHAALRAYLETADPITAETALALLDAEEDDEAATPQVQADPPAELAGEYVIDRNGLVWRVVRDGGMATRADYTGITSIGIEALRQEAGPLTNLADLLAATPAAKPDEDREFLDAAARGMVDRDDAAKPEAVTEPQRDSVDAGAGLDVDRLARAEWIAEDVEQYGVPFSGWWNDAGNRRRVEKVAAAYAEAASPRSDAGSER